MNSFERFLCAFGGADIQILQICPKIETIKYSSQGLLVFILTSIAGFTSVYSLMIIHTASAESLLVSLDFSDIFNSFFIGSCWTFIVFNSYRLLLSSTGYGDGSSLIEFKEIIFAAPKILLAVAIGLCSGSAITVTLFHDDMLSFHSSQQIEYQKELDKSVDKRYTEQLDDLYQGQSEVISKLRAIKAKIANYQNTNAINNNSKHALIDERESLTLQINNYTRKHQAIQDEINTLKSRNSLFIVNSTDFLTVIDKALEFHLLVTVSIFIFSLFIYLTPFIARILWAKSSYEYLIEFQNYILLSKHGIAPRAHEIVSGDSIEFVDRFTIPEKISNHVMNQHLKKVKTNQEKTNKYYFDKLSELERKSY